MSAQQPSTQSASARRGVDLSGAPPDVQSVLNRIIHLEDENERLAAKVARLQEWRSRLRAENEFLWSLINKTVDGIANEGMTGWAGEIHRSLRSLPFGEGSES